MNVMNEVFVSRHRILGESICKALLEQGLEIGFDEQALPLINWIELEFAVKQDPADGSDCLTGEWKDPSGYRIGQIQFNGDGSFFAEHDIVLAHPSDKRWFVEAVEGWGRGNNITTEPRLLEAV